MSVPAAPFDYDPAPGLDVTESSATRKDGHTVRDVSYASPLGGRVPAYLVVPDGPGPFAALVYVHHGQGNRASYLPEAEALAGAGVVSLLIDAPFLRPEYPQLYALDGQPRPVEEAARTEARLYRQLVIDTRRGIDLLTARPEIDPGRLGYVGHSLGATWGLPLAGIETRVKAYVLLAGFASLTKAYRTQDHPDIVAFRARFPSPEKFEAYLAVLAPLDGSNFIARSAPAALFFQFARQDQYISREQAEEAFREAAEPKEMAWYDCDHFFTEAPAARFDRARWLADKLGFAPLPASVEAALAVA